MAASLGLNPETFFNPCSSYSASPFMADYAPSFPGGAAVDAAFCAELEDHRLFDFEYSPASIFAGEGGADDHNEKKTRHLPAIRALPEANPQIPQLTACLTAAGHLAPTLPPVPAGSRTAYSLLLRAARCPRAP
ncbi:hypothetical protein EJB05_33163 [Eragrostis curvula]|uniref:Uncharacterized protein n=1 Tax=Eragrostis curvula TaxID=38414 RepID=A0A5J9U117_9POAL|nr:hypothetical protein EJB05_33163 [Eragrostis curvula]